MFCRFRIISKFGGNKISQKETMCRVQLCLRRNQCNKMLVWNLMNVNTKTAEIVMKQQIICSFQVNYTCSVYDMSSLNSLAKPKSASLIRKLGSSTSTLLGFKSLCRTLRVWQNSRAESIWCMKVCKQKKFNHIYKIFRISDSSTSILNYLSFLINSNKCRILRSKIDFTSKSQFN